MRDSERGSAADGERSSVEGPNASGRRGSPRRCGPTRSGRMDDDQAPPARRPWSGRRVAAPARVRRVDRTRGTTAQWPAPMPALALQERRGRAHREAAHWTVWTCLTGKPHPVADRPAQHGTQPVRARRRRGVGAAREHVVPPAGEMGLDEVPVDGGAEDLAQLRFREVDRRFPTRVLELHREVPADIRKSQAGAGNVGQQPHQCRRMRPVRVRVVQEVFVGS